MMRVRKRNFPTPLKQNIAQGNAAEDDEYEGYPICSVALHCVADEDTLALGIR